MKQEGASCLRDALGTAKNSLPVMFPEPSGICKVRLKVSEKVVVKPSWFPSILIILESVGTLGFGRSPHRTEAEMQSLS